MTSIGLTQKQIDMFPASMILLQLKEEDLVNEKEKMLVEEYKRLNLMLEKDVSSWRYRRIKRKKKKIEEHKALSNLLFYQRMVLVKQAHALEMECLKEVERLRNERYKLKSQE